MKYGETRKSQTWLTIHLRVLALGRVEVEPMCGSSGCLFLSHRKSYRSVTVLDSVSSLHSARRSPRESRKFSMKQRQKSSFEHLGTQTCSWLRKKSFVTGGNPLQVILGLNVQVSRVQPSQS